MTQNNGSVKTDSPCQVAEWDALSLSAAEPLYLAMRGDGQVDYGHRLLSLTADLCSQWETERGDVVVWLVDGAERPWRAVAVLRDSMSPGGPILTWL